MSFYCGLCGTNDGIGVGCCCWVCEPPHKDDASYSAYWEELQKWRARLWKKAYETAVANGTYR